MTVPYYRFLVLVSLRMFMSRLELEMRLAGQIVQVLYHVLTHISKTSSTT